MIRDLQLRLREIGRIRAGMRVRVGAADSRPTKLDTFRLTSPDRHVIEAAATLYGGNVSQWEGPAGPQWELLTETAQIEVTLLPETVGFSQYYELWSGGGCLRRCDGDTELLTGEACLCAAQEERACKPHTRLSVVLSGVGGLGVWRLDTEGWNAAAELAGTLQLLRAAGHTSMFPARLRLEQRSMKRDGQTLRFAVPVIDADLSLASALSQQPTQTLERGPDSLEPARLQSEPALPAADTKARKAPVRRRQAPIRPTGAQPRTAAQVAADLGGEVVAEIVPSATKPTQAEAAPADPDATQRSRRIAQWLREAGIVDEARYDFLDAFSCGGYRSGKEVPAAHLPELHRHIEMLKRRELRLEKDASGAPILVHTNTGLIATPKLPNKS